MSRPWTTLRRSGQVGILALALVLAGLLPASATFSTSRQLAQTTITTATIDAPTNIAAVLTSCANNRWMSVTVSWTPSTFSRVSGYTVNAYRSDGSVTAVASTDAATTSASFTLDKLSTGATTMVFTVTATTAAGWTAESVKSGPLTC